MKKVRNIIAIIALLIIVALIGTVCYGYYKRATMEVKNPIVTMEVEKYGTIKLELYPEIAPETVSNFIALAKNGFYDGLKFHRVVEGFMIQGGDINGNGTGSPKLSNLGIDVAKDGETGKQEDRDYNIVGEFLANGYDNNTLKHKEGVISMARGDYTSQSPTLTTQSYNSGGSQFFIMTKDTTSLDGLYAAFGKVTEGLDIVHQIEKAEVKSASSEEGTEESSTSTEQSTPVEDIIISKVTVETYGVDYGLPQTLETFNYNKWIYETYGINLDLY